MKVVNVMGEIVADPSWKWTDADVAPQDIQAALAEDTDDGVELAINSPGGDVTGGLAICNMIKAAQANGVKVTAHIYGLAASMASVVACACDEIVMDEAAFLMIHNPWTKAVGDADELRGAADTLDKMRDAIMGFYLAKFDKTEDELKAMLDEETWISGADIAACGLRASVVPTTVKAAACLSRRDFAKAPEAARAFFKFAPEKPVAEDAPAPVAEAAPAQEPEPSNEVARLTDALAKCEAKRRDAQSAADKAKAEAAALRRQIDDLTACLAKQKADASAELAKCEAEKKELEDRLATAAVRVFAPVATGDAATYEEALAQAKTPAEKVAVCDRFFGKTRN